jgi:hypothetical protein
MRVVRHLHLDLERVVAPLIDVVRLGCSVGRRSELSVGESMSMDRYEDVLRAATSRITRQRPRCRNIYVVTQWQWGQSRSNRSPQRIP